MARFMRRCVLLEGRAPGGPDAALGLWLRLLLTGLLLWGALAANRQIVDDGATAP